MTSTNIYITKIQENCISNKYTKWYIQLCNRAQNRILATSKSSAKNKAKQLLGYAEGHHILPACLCTKNEKNDLNNIAFLTAREHFICHWLLCKMFNNSIKYKMFYAFNLSSVQSKNHKRITPKNYEIIRKYVSLASSILTNDRDYSNFIPWNKGKQLTQTHKNNISKAWVGLKRPTEWRERNSKLRIERGLSKGKNNGMFGRTHTKDAKEKMSERNKLNHNNSRWSGLFWITNGILQKRISNQDLIPLGWIKGTKHHKNAKGFLI